MSGREGHACPAVSLLLISDSTLSSGVYPYDWNERGARSACNIMTQNTYIPNGEQVQWSAPGWDWRAGHRQSCERPWP